MNARWLHPLVLTALAAPLVFVAACGDDTDPTQPTTGSVAGEITATVTCDAADPSADCMGALYVGLFTSADLSGAAVASVTLPQVDLSTGGPESYTLDAVAPGTYFLAAFLDDNGNADAGRPLPDAGDLVATAGVVQVTLVAGQTAQGDLTLDLRLSNTTSAPCDAVTCGGHGTCQAVGGSAECTCDAGYSAQGLECIADAPLPPTDLSCPAPGCAGDALCEQWMGRDWYYVSNDRTCSPGSVLMFQFAADGTFWFRHEYSASGSSQNFMYGCWSLTSSDASRLTLAYDYEDTNTFNCLSPGASGDPPCTSVLEQTDSDTWFQGQAWDSYGERHVFRSLGQAGCDWCSDAAACCPEPGWVEDGTGVICP